MAIFRLLSSGSPTAQDYRICFLALLGLFDCFLEFEVSSIVRIACMGWLHYPGLHEYFFHFGYLLALLRGSLSTPARGPTFRTWKTTIHLCVLRKPSGTLSGAFGGTTQGCHVATHRTQLVLGQVALS